ncbi:MAG: ROK family protein [Candidatus Saccharimonadales bacterium]
MYLAIDFGGTKTLVCTLDDSGRITHEARFETPADYPDFINQLAEQLAALPEHPSTGVMSVPGLVDQVAGTILAVGNRPWRDCNLVADIREKTGVTLSIMNDARLAGLAEAIAVQDTYHRVLYLTVSTGIGGAFAVDGQLVRELDTLEVGKMPLFFDGRMQAWEDFASGRAIVGTYNQRASDITDPNIWREIADKLVLGIAPLCAIFQPEAIVFGGGAGMHADNFKDFIRQDIEGEHLHPVITPPSAYLTTTFNDEAVIYGCYQFAKIYGIV